MIRTALPLLLVIACAACGQDVRQRQLGDLALGDMAVLQELGQDLSAEERALLATYSIAHWPGSSAFCGEVLIDQSGRQPSTIGEAIAMTKARETAREEQLARAALPKTPLEELLERRSFLEGQQEQLFVQKELMLNEHGNAARQTASWAAIEREIVQGYAVITKLNEDIGQKAQ
jgi:hypothetical protein